MADAVKSPAMEVDIKPVVDAEQEQKPAAIEEERRDESQPPPAKRQRTVDTKAEDRKRGQRLFGNLLGTLAKFKGEEKSRGQTERAKRRDEVASRIASKIQSETQLNNEIHSLEREIKTCRIELEGREASLRQRQLAIRTRARQLPRVSHLLITASTTWKVAPGQDELPLGYSPARDKLSAECPKPLYFRPGKLLPDQQQLLDTQKARIDEQIRREQEELEDLQRTTEEAVQSLRSRIEKASADLATRKPKRNMVSPMEQADAGRSPVQHETTVETKEVDMDVEPETPTVADDAEVEY